MINYDELNPGVRKLVRFLNDNGFETTDSGDGINYANGMESACPYPMIAIRVDPVKLVEECKRLFALLSDCFVNFNPNAYLEEGMFETPCIEGSYDPYNGIGIITLINVISKTIGL